ncbi:MAG: ribosome biogenesis GTPase Der [Planctomycetota bacterium]|jgi:GTP-binding protein
MRIPTVAIVGRPNVGKSTIFNLICGERISIVEPTAGVTRDRVVRIVEVEGRPIELVDTGGIGIVDMDRLEDHVEQQIAVALAAADLIMMVVSVRDERTPLDETIAERIRGLGRPVLLVCNKADEEQYAALAGEFYSLGFGEPSILSATQAEGRSDLLERLVAMLPDFEGEAEGDDDDDGVIKIAVVGKRNAGKSTFVNALAQKERVIVSEIAGTTRDAVDVRFERDGEVYCAIDTAGMRKKRKVENSIEFFSQARTEQAIGRADVVIFMFDVEQTVSQVDKQLADVIATKKKPCVLVGNKWDLARKKIATGDFHEYLKDRLPGLAFSPMVFTSAIEQKGVWPVLEVARELYHQARIRVSTGQLNRVIQAAFSQLAPRMKGGVPKIYYATQASVAPPRIVLMVNKPAAFNEAYRRYLRNRLREKCGFAEVPIDLVLRERLTQYVVEERKERKERKRKGKRVRKTE